MFDEKLFKKGGLVDKPLGAGGKKSGPPPKSGPTPHGMKKGGIAKGCGKVTGSLLPLTLGIRAPGLTKIRFSIFSGFWLA